MAVAALFSGTGGVVQSIIDFLYVVKHVVSTRMQVVTFPFFRFGGGLAAFSPQEPPDDAEKREAQDKNASEKEKERGE